MLPTLYCDVNGEYRGMNDIDLYGPKKGQLITTLSLWDTYRALAFL
ncbi:glycoside hydrolase domain-containing protein [Bacteroides acidifaciens]